MGGGSLLGGTGRMSPLVCFCNRSTAPVIVVPLMARHSSGMPANFMIPLSGRTPSELDMKDCIMAALRLLVVGNN